MDLRFLESEYIMDAMNNNRIAVFFLIFLTVACNGKKGNETIVQDSLVVRTDSLESIEVLSPEDTQFSMPAESACIQLDSINTQPVTTLPVGSKLLLTYKFPEAWLSHSDSETGIYPPTGINKKHMDAIDSVLAYYNRLHHGEKYLLPVINKLEYVKLNEKEDISPDDSLVYSIKHCNYRLPDFGMYECYYTYNSGRYVRTNGFEDLTHGEAGHLIFYDRKTKNAKYITIYDQENDVETWNGYRIFFIHKDKSIQLFSVDYGEEETGFSKIYKINIHQNGEIVIELVH